MSHRAEPEDATTEAPAATPAPTLPTRAIDAETKRIKDCAVALCADVDAAGPGKAIDRLYLYLDLLDRKGNSIVTVNSFLVAIIGVVLFRPLGLFEPIAPTYPTEHGFWWGSVLVLGTGAMFLSLLSILWALAVFRVRWRFMEHACQDGTLAFDRELDQLCDEARRRVRVIRRIHSLTFLAFLLAAAGILFSYVRLLP